ncbi:helix-turn-helix domain-containing protein [Desulfovibrio cuneatus]
MHHREGGIIVPHISQQDLASLLGIYRGSLHKAFARLREVFWNRIPGTN